MVLAWIFLGSRLSFLPVVVTLSSAVKHLLLLHASIPLIVQRIQMHFDINGGPIAVALRLSMTRNACYCSQAWMAREYVCMIWLPNSMKVKSNVIVTR